MYPLLLFLLIKQTLYSFLFSSIIHTHLSTDLLSLNYFLHHLINLSINNQSPPLFSTPLNLSIYLSVCVRLSVYVCVCVCVRASVFTCVSVHTFRPPLRVRIDVTYGPFERTASWLDDSISLIEGKREEEGSAGDERRKVGQDEDKRIIRRKGKNTVNRNHEWKQASKICSVDQLTNSAMGIRPEKPAAQYPSKREDYVTVWWWCWKV
jgi:hypothetical protein